MLKLKAVQVLPGLNFSFTIYSLPLPPVCITAKLPINKVPTEVSSMYFFFTSSQVISSLTSTYILPYPKGENQLPLPQARSLVAWVISLDVPPVSPLMWAVSCCGLSGTWWWPVESWYTAKRSLPYLLPDVNKTASNITNAVNALLSLLFTSPQVLQLLLSLSDCLTDCLSLPLPKSKMQYESSKNLEV